MPRVRRSTGLSLNALEDRTTPAAGLMDPSFGGGDGIVTFGLAGFYGSGATGVAPRPDGTTVVVGHVDSPDGLHGTVFRLTEDGSLDPSFGGGDGIVTVQLGRYKTNFRAVALQPDGKIVATGSVYGPTGYTIVTARFLPDGTPDPAFNGTGYVITDFSASEEGGYNLALQADGKIVVVGNGDGLLVFRYLANGALDPTFNLDGIFRHDPGGYGAFGEGVAVQPDGKIVAAGQGVPSGSPNRGFLLLRLTTDGNLDSTFDGDGLVHTQFAEGSQPGVRDVAVLPDGRIAAVGSVLIGPYGQHAVARYLPTGALDPGFSGDGRIVLQYQPDHPGGELQAVAVQPDGKVIAGGYVVFAGESVLVRFTENGEPDPTFGVGNFRLAPGVVVTNAEGDDSIQDVAVRPDGRIVTAGKANNKNAVLQYTGETVAVPDAYTATEDAPLTVAAPGVLANDPTPNASPRVVSLVDGPDHATSFTLNVDGSFSYTPLPDYHGPDSFTYKFTAGSEESTPAVVNLTVHPANDAPTAAADAYDFPRSGPLTVSAADGVLKNDADADGDPLTAVLVDPPSQGTVDLNADGSFTFTYPEGLTDTVTFTYRATDGTADGPVTTVTLTPAANAPPVSGADFYALPVFSSLTVSAAGGVLKNDTDADGDALTAVLVTPPPVGVLTFRPDGSFTYGFSPAFAGSVTFTYAATDGTDQGAPATVTLTQESRVAVNGPVVYVFGTDGPDAVRVRPAGGGAVRVTLQTPAGLTSQVVSLPPKPFYQIVVALGPGNDRLDVDAGHRRVRAYGGAGDDVIWTGAGADLLFGDDDLAARATGDDAIDAGGGFNQVGTGDGDDVVRTGGGPDIVVAGAGRKQIATGAGRDTVKSGAGGSFIDAGAGNDEVTVTGGSNWIEGGSGSDVLLGGTGADRIFGGFGQDLVSGGKGADLVVGGSGNDILFEGTVQTVTSTGPTLATLLSRYRSTKRAALDAIGEKLFVVVDLASADTLTGGAGTDWFWSRGVPDILDRTAAEPRN